MELRDFIVGRLWNNVEIDIMEFEGVKYALNGWNGEKWLTSWKVGDNHGSEVLEDGGEYSVEPLYDWGNCPKNDDGEFITDELRIKGFGIWKN